MRKAIILLLVFLFCLTACGSEAGVSITDAPDFVAPLEVALKGLIDGNGESYLSAFPSKMVEDYKIQDVYLYYYSLSDMTAWLKNNLRIYGESYGGELFVKGGIEDVKTVAVSSLGDANLDYHTYMRYVTEENTQEVKAATFRYTIGGEDSSEEKEALLYFVKQDGVWYLHPCFAFYTF